MDGFVNFGDLGIYTSGGAFIPEADYALEFDVHMHTDKKADGTPVGEAFLAMGEYHWKAVMVWAGKPIFLISLTRRLVRRLSLFLGVLDNH